MRKYLGRSSIAGSLIEKTMLEKNVKQETLCKKLQLMGINIDRTHLYRILKGTVILKDFELIAICKILDVNYDELKNTL